LQRMLEQTKVVTAFTRALPNDGGTGGKYVLLKRRKN